MSLGLLFHYLLLNMFRMLVHPTSGTWDLLWIYFVNMQDEAQLQPAYGYHSTPAEPQRNTNTHRTRAIQHTK